MGDDYLQQVRVLLKQGLKISRIVVFEGHFFALGESQPILDAKVALFVVEHQVVVLKKRLDESAVGIGTAGK